MSSESPSPSSSRLSSLPWNTTWTVCVLPTLEASQSIQMMRRVADRQYHRWPPHINLIFPFVAVETCHLKEIQQAVEGCEPFQMELAGFDRFVHKSSATLFLQANQEAISPFTQLYKSLQACVPQCKPKHESDDKERESTFHPHLTIGQYKNGTQADRARTEFMQTWKSVTFDVSHVYVMHRTAVDTPFTIVYAIPLGKSTTTSSHLPIGMTAYDFFVDKEQDIADMEAQQHAERVAKNNRRSTDRSAVQEKQTAAKQVSTQNP